MNIELSPISRVRAGAHLSSALVFAASIALSGCASESGPGPSDPEVTGTTAVSFEEWEKTVYRNPETGTWVVDDDTPIADIGELRSFYETYVRPGALIIDVYNGTINRWDAQTVLNLVYCVNRPAFGGDYDRMVAAMADAGSSWSHFARVRFIHNVAQDGQCTSNNPDVLFDVQPNPPQGYLGLAFFPHYPRSQRVVYMAAAQLRTPAGAVTLTGVTRHELGHVLGFRHEHIHPSANSTCQEGGSWQAITIYDSNSVMHYPQCNGTNKGDLNITPIDAAGAARIYGNP